jgi:hypothetical protein
MVTGLKADMGSISDLKGDVELLSRTPILWIFGIVFDVSAYISLAKVMEYTCSKPVYQSFTVCSSLRLGCATGRSL